MILIIRFKNFHYDFMLENSISIYSRVIQLSGKLSDNKVGEMGLWLAGKA